jgi:hypothetical protein
MFQHQECNRRQFCSDGSARNRHLMIETKTVYETFCLKELRQEKIIKTILTFIEDIL